MGAFCRVVSGNTSPNAGAVNLNILEIRMRGAGFAGESLVCPFVSLDFYLALGFRAPPCLSHGLDSLGLHFERS